MFVKLFVFIILFTNCYYNRFPLLQTLAWIEKLETTLYPVITTQSSRIIDILVNLEDVRKRVLSELNKALLELNVQIKSIQAFVERGNQMIFMLYVTQDIFN